MRRQPRQKLAVKLPIVCHAQRLAGVPFFVHRNENGKLLVSITSDKLFHIAAAPPCAWGFARSLRKIPLQRFHSIMSESAAISKLFFRSMVAQDRHRGYTTNDRSGG